MSERPIFTIPGAAKVAFDPECKAVIVYWEHFRQVREVVDLVAVEAQRAGAKSVIVVPAAGQAMNREDATLFESYVPQQQIQAGLVATITVASSSALTNMAAKRWKNPGGDGAIAICDAPSLNDAKRMARNYI